MRAIIPVAGTGQRLGQETTKCLVQVDDEDTIFDKQLRCLSAVGITEAVAVAGRHYGDLMARYGHSAGLTIIQSPRVDLDNGYSLFAAIPYLTNECVIMNGDVLFDVAILDDLLSDPRGNCIVVDDTVKADDEAMKAFAIHGVPYRLTKSPSASELKNQIGEFTGICKLSSADGSSVARFADILTRYGNSGRRFYWDDAVEEHMTLERYGVQYTRGRRWIEIDFPSDLARAKDMFARE